MHSKGVDGGELDCRPGRAPVAVDKATVAGKTMVCAVAATGKTTTAIDVVVAAAAAAGAGEFVVPAGATMMAHGGVVQTGISPLSQPRWRTLSLIHI